MSLDRVPRGQEDGVHNVRTWSLGFGCTGPGLGRIGDAFGEWRICEERPGSSPTSVGCFPCSGACWPLSVHNQFTYGSLRGPFSLVAGVAVGCLLPDLDRRFVLRYLLMGDLGLGNMTEANWAWRFLLRLRHQSQRPLHWTRRHPPASTGTSRLPWSCAPDGKSCYDGSHHIGLSGPVHRVARCWPP